MPKYFLKFYSHDTCGNASIYFGFGCSDPLDISNFFDVCGRNSNIWLSLGGFQEKGPDDSHHYNTHVLVDCTGNIKKIYRKIHL